MPHHHDAIIIGAGFADLYMLYRGERTTRETTPTRARNPGLYGFRCNS